MKSLLTKLMPFILNQPVLFFLNVHRTLCCLLAGGLRSVDSGTSGVSLRQTHAYPERITHTSKEKERVRGQRARYEANATGRFKELVTRARGRSTSQQ